MAHEDDVNESIGIACIIGISHRPRKRSNCIDCNEYVVPLKLVANCASLRSSVTSVNAFMTVNS